MLRSRAKPGRRNKNKEVKVIHKNNQAFPFTTSLFLDPPHLLLSSLLFLILSSFLLLLLVLLQFGGPCGPTSAWWRDGQSISYQTSASCARTWMPPRSTLEQTFGPAHIFLKKKNREHIDCNRSIRILTWMFMAQRSWLKLYMIYV